MVAFGLLVTKEEAVPKILEVRRNLLVEDIVKNPFNGKITAYGKDFFTVVMNPVYPRVYYFALFPLLLPLLWWGTWWATAGLIVGGVMGSTAVFWSNRFYFVIFYFATKRGVKYVSPGEALERVV